MSHNASIKNNQEPIMPGYEASWGTRYLPLEIYKSMKLSQRYLQFNDESTCYTSRVFAEYR